LLYIAFFFAGSTLVILNTSIKETDNFSGKTKTISGKTIIANIIEAPVEKKKIIKTTLKIVSVKRDTAWFAANTKVLAYFRKDKFSQELELGDQVITNNIFSEIKNSGNPDEFDYKKYLSFRNIYLQTFLETGKWKIISKEHGNIFLLYANKWRKKLLQIYRNQGIYDEEFAVAAALTLGYKDELDTETKQAFSASGAMHILAVSGLHVGIIYFILSRLLSFFERKPFGKVIKIILIMAFLWTFALLSGLSPSVFRAVIMFSFINAGNLFKRNISIYNILAASAIILLLINPYYITSIGFLLSYSAITSIIYFQPKFYSLISIKNYFLDKIWIVTTASVTAQIGTFPICFYYFHQFPVYFILTNLLVIPLAILIIGSGVAVLVFSFIEPVSLLFAKILILLVELLNNSVRFIESLPHSIIDNISFSFSEVLLIYLLIIFVSLFFAFKRITHIYTSLIVVILIMFVWIYQEYTTTIQRKFIVYNVKNSSVYSFIKGSNNTVVIDSTIIKDLQKLSYTTKNNWINLQALDIGIIDIDMNKPVIRKSPKEDNSAGFLYKNSFIHFFGKTIKILRNTKSLQYSTQKKIGLDYIILSKNIRTTIAEILELYNVKLLIIDSSNSQFNKDKWLIECKKLKLNCYSVSDMGAFRINLN
jgi:competence protein ComEC